MTIKLSELDKDALQQKNTEFEIDCADSKVLSSEAEQILDLLLEQGAALSFINVYPAVYEALDRKGIPQRAEVQRSFRLFSTKGLKKLGEGNNGAAYRIDDELMLKTFRDANALEEIDTERRCDRQAFVSGVETMITYDIVKLEDEEGYGLILEKAGSGNLKKYLLNHPEERLKYAEKMGAFAAKVNSIKADQKTLGKVTDRYRERFKIIAGEFKGYGKTVSQAMEMLDMIDRAPDSDAMIHGDIHFKNLRKTKDDNLMIIDFGEAGYGSNLLEIARVYAMTHSVDPASMDLFGCKKKETEVIFDEFVKGYFGSLGASDREQLYEFLQNFTSLYYLSLGGLFLKSRKFPKPVIRFALMLGVKKNLSRQVQFCRNFDFGKFAASKKHSENL